MPALISVGVDPYSIGIVELNEGEEFDWERKERRLPRIPSWTETLLRAAVDLVNLERVRLGLDCRSGGGGLTGADA